MLQYSLVALVILCIPRAFSMSLFDMVFGKGQTKNINNLNQEVNNVSEIQSPNNYTQSDMFKSLTDRMGKPEEAPPGTFTHSGTLGDLTNSPDSLYDALASAETGAYQNPWIRTQVAGSGSSAYGPVQMTGGENSMMANVYNDPQLAERMGITDDEIGYIQNYLGQADEFLSPESDEYGSTYGYGGGGILTSDEDKTMYKNVAKKMMNYELGRQGGDLDKFIEEWRFGQGGVPKDISKEELELYEEYRGKVKDSLDTSAIVNPSHQQAF